MRNKIFGTIGVLWGGSILGWHIFGDAVAVGNNAYQTGQSAALVMGGVLLVAGFYYFFKT